MKKKEQIVLHKNMRNGKGATQQQKIQAYHMLSNGLSHDDKMPVLYNKKILSHQKQEINTKKVSNHKYISSKTASRSKQSNNKEIGYISSSGRENERNKSKKKSESVNKESIKLIMGKHFQKHTLLASQMKNIYTAGYSRQKKQKSKKSHSQKHSTGSQLSSSLQKHIKTHKNHDSLIMKSTTHTISSQSQRQDVADFVSEIEQSDFSDLHEMKMHCINFIFRNRIVRDEQYDRLFDLMVDKFPQKQEIFRAILFEIVSSLDS